MQLCKLCKSIETLIFHGLRTHNFSKNILYLLSTSAMFLLSGILDFRTWCVSYNSATVCSLPKIISGNLGISYQPTFMTIHCPGCVVDLFLVDQETDMKPFISYIYS